MRFFFYGTLIEPEILHAVLCRPIARAHRRNAVLHGYHRVYRRGASYPVIVADAASEVEGIVISELTARDVALLRAYEGPEYIVDERSVRLSGDGFVRAKVFMPALHAASRAPGTHREGGGDTRTLPVRWRETASRTRMSVGVRPRLL